jgi:CheY-like chemotaxis protein
VDPAQHGEDLGGGGGALVGVLGEQPLDQGHQLGIGLGGQAAQRGHRQRGQGVQEAGGIGLGLAVTRELVGLMGGSIRLERPRSQGTRFIVTMPVELWTERAQEPARPAKGRAIFSGRVLVVDDDPVSRELAAMMLRRMGVEADTAANGREGLGLLLGTPYDLALVECRMPELDGLEMTRLFRESAPPDRLRVPIIALTANTQQSDVDSCLAAGMDCYIPKTLIDGSLQQCLDRYLKPETDS